MRKHSPCWALRAVAVVAATATIAAGLASCGASADADHSKDGSWKTVYGNQKLGGRYQSLAVGDAKHAWAFGNTDPDANKHTRIDRWDGKRWKPDTFPSEWTITPEFADASSADNVWAGAQTADKVFTLLHYDGHQWSEHQIHFDTVRDIEAVGSNEVLLLGDGTLRRFDGTTTAQETAPTHSRFGVVMGADDTLYAVGARKNQPYAEKWDGRKWTSMDAPASRPKNCSDGGFSDMYVRSVDDIWAVGNSMCGNSFKSFMGHWNGKKWTMTVDTKHNQRFDQVVDDGHGGIWVVDATGKYVHRDAAGTLTRYDAGTKDAYGNLPRIANLPGTRSMIGTATTNPKSQSSKTPPYGLVRQFQP